MKRATLPLLLVMASCARGADSGLPTPAGLVLDAGADVVTFADGCGDITLNVTTKTPTVVFLIDQSGSMGEQFEGEVTKWEAVRRTLTDPATGIVDKLQNEVRFGATLYYSAAGLSAATCPVLTSTPDPITFGSAGAIAALFSGQSPAGDGPTGESIDATAKRLASLEIEGPRFIVLATDGEPDSCEVPNPSSVEDARNQSLAAAQLAFARGIGMLIISVGSKVDEEHLQQMANAGAGLPLHATRPENDAKTYRALDPKSLDEKLRSIVDSVRQCSFTLDGKVRDPASGTVTLDGAPLVFGDKDGFHMLGGSELVLDGAACEKIQSGVKALHVVFPCASVLR